jgi:hypothetical protein
LLSDLFNEELKSNKQKGKKIYGQKNYLLKISEKREFNEDQDKINIFLSKIEEIII